MQPLTPPETTCSRNELLPENTDMRTTPSKPSKLRLVAWLLVGVGALGTSASGCAEAPSAAKEASAPPQADATQGAYAPSQTYPQQGVSSQRAATVDEALADLGKAERDLSESLDPQRAVPLGTDRCTVVCKALSSMRASATRLCELTTDERCDDAKARLTKAESKAKSACPACEGA